MQIEQRKVDTLIPYVNNSRKHSDEQVAQIAASIKEFGWTNPILVDGDNGIIAGHGRLMAARKLGMVEIPVIELAHLSEPQRKALIIADNKLALNAEWDEKLLALEMQELVKLNLNTEITGFNNSEIEELNLLGNIEESELNYSTKIESPTYTPKGDKPELIELVNSERNIALINKINESKISKYEKAFLIKAASRHNAFNYHLIAEYYCHASPEMQELMEDSALVIIDFDKAIEQGYVEMSKKLSDIYSESYPESEDIDE
jgi:hypothetical protein